MNYYYITGTSRGLGKAMAEMLLQDEPNVVFGISRSQTIKHPNYHHFQIDLNENLAGFRFPDHPDAKTIVLINNSGVLGPVKPTGKVDHQLLKHTLRINLTAPLILIDKFIGAYQETQCKKIIINISSGAARYPFPSWISYCSSKAGLDMTTKVIETEQKDKTHKIFAFAVAPGIMDTEMQTEIRAANPTDFPMYNTFKGYKENNQLWTPKMSAEKILSICHEPESYENVLLDVRKL
jgi:benzil reductase ((S)-benzoin forming)